VAGKSAQTEHAVELVADARLEIRKRHLDQLLGAEPEMLRAPL